MTKAHKKKYIFTKIKTEKILIDNYITVKLWSDAENKNIKREMISKRIPKDFVSRSVRLLKYQLFWPIYIYIYIYI